MMMNADDERLQLSVESRPLLSALGVLIHALPGGGSEASATGQGRSARLGLGEAPGGLDPGGVEIARAVVAAEPSGRDLLQIDRHLGQFCR